MKKSLPIGVMNFADLRLKDYYVVDKTMMIEEFLTRKFTATLITRPRRFGKSLNMSMMAEFFDITKDSSKVFQNTNIAKRDTIKEMNQYPTIFLSFADAKGTLIKSVKAIKEQIAQAYQKYAYALIEMDEFEKPYYEIIRKSLMNPDNGSLQGTDNAIKFLTRKLQEFHKKKVMVFIDEYDTPFIEAHVEGYYDVISSDLASILQSALKGNDALEYAMLTGIQRVSKESIFSHLNSVKVYSVLDDAYASYFGFTTEETKTLLNYFELDLNDEVKAMYDGYNMGGVEIYNPWSIINYADQKKLISYWVNTSSNTMIKEAMKQSDISFKKDYEKFIQEGHLVTQASLSTSFYEVKEDSNLWGLFVNAGYLTIEKAYDSEEEVYRLRIPNREVLREFKSLTASYLQVPVMQLKDLYDGFRFNDKEKFLRAYKYLLLKNPSYHDLKDENSYHMFLLGICLYLNNEYEILSNREVGSGRCDIILKAKSQQIPSYIIEFKYVKVKTDLKSLAKQAIEQIEERKYDYNLQGEVVYIGLAHYGKEVEMEYK